MIERRTIQKEVEEVVEVIKAKSMKDVDVFVTTDGREHYSMRDAESHQSKLDKAWMLAELKLQMKVLTVGDYDIAYVTNQEDVNTYFVGDSYCWEIKIDEKDLPNWFKIEYSDGNDYRSSFYIEKLDGVLEQMMDEYNEIVEHVNK